MSLFKDLDLGADDYSGEKQSSFDSLVSKPTQRKYQPFGGPMPQAPQQQQQPIDYGYEVQPTYENNVFDESDAYGQLKKAHSQYKQFASENKRSASHYEDLYDDFVQNEFQPFFDDIGGFGDFDTDEDRVSFVDQMYADELKASEEEDGFFGGESDRKKAAKENIKKYARWRNPNGLRDKFLRLKAEKDQRRKIADTASQREFQLFEQLTSIPIPAREALDARLKSRSGSPMSKSSVDAMLNRQNWEAPSVDPITGDISNLERTDPRKSLNLLPDPITGDAQQATIDQSRRLAAATRGDMQGVLAKRDLVRKERNLRDRGVIFSSNGLMDARPIGMSRRDVDLLDIEEMRKAGFTEYQGKPLEQAFAELGGEERLEMSKILQAVYGARSNYEDAQLQYLKVAGSDASEKKLEAMEAARDNMQQVIALAAEKGLDNELFEQADSVGWFSALGNAIKRGGLMSEMSDYSDDFLTNTLTSDEMQKFIDAASEMEKLPGSSSLERYKKAVGTKASDGILSAIGRLLFDHPDAIPELFAESMASFLPATIKALIPSMAAGAATGAAVGTAVAPGAGTLLGAKTGAMYGARASWGVASFVLEASGVALEGMQELGIDWKNPKVFAAAWTNESIRDKIQDKMVKKGLPIAIADAMTGMLAGNVMGVLNHTGNTVFKGGKLLDKAAWNASKGSVARFSPIQRTRNAALEIGADSTLGMSGEFLGQWAAKEPGEAWDFDAIAAEGVVGIGPGIAGAAFEAMGPGARYFGNAPVVISGEQETETGTTGTVDRAGYTATYNTFSSPEAMMNYFRTLSSNERSLAFTERFINLIFRIRPEAMSRLKIAVSPRTPAAELKNRGSFETKDGHVLMYLNENEFNNDPMGTFFHEAGHFASFIMFEPGQLQEIWGKLGEKKQLEAYTQYYTKDFGATFESQTEDIQKKIKRAFNRTDNDVLAEEWFSYQFARVLTSNFAPDPSVSKAVKNANNKIFRPLFAEYVGTENLTGDKKSNDLALDAQILDFVKNGLTPSMKEMVESTASEIQQVRTEFQEAYQSEEGLTEAEQKGFKKREAQLRKQLQAKLQALGLSPKLKAQTARAINAMLGADILTTNVSFYQKPGLLQQAASRDPEEPENREVEREIIGKVGQAYGKKKAQKTVVEFEGERPKADPEPDIKTENEALNPQIRRAQEKLTKAQQLPETSDAQKKNKAKAVKRYQADLNRLLQKGVSQNQELVTEKESESRRQKRMAPGKKKKDSALKVKTRKEEQETYVRAETTKKDLKKVKQKERDTVEFKGKQAVEKRLDLLIPKTQEGRVALQKSLNTLKRVKKVVSNAKTLEAEIGKAAKKLGANASYASILAEILQLETLVETSPISLLGEIRKEVNPTSRRKVPSSEDIDGILVGIRQKIDDINDQLDNRINEIDRELRDLRKGLETVEKPAEINRNIKELENLKTMARQYKALIAPEENTMDWTNTLHPKLLYAPAKLDEKGEPILDKNGMKIPKNKDQGMKRFTFGELATMKDFKRVVVYFQKTYKNDPKQHSRYYGQKPSHALWDYLTNTENIKSLQSYADKKDNEAFKYQNSEGKEFTLVAGEMLARVYAAKSAALVKPQKEIGNQPITTDSRQVFYPDSYKMEEEANIASVVAEGIRRVVKDARAKNKVSKLPIHSESPTAVEMLTLSMISDRIAESIGVPANRKENLDKQVYIAERNEQARKIRSERIEAYPGIDGKPEKGLPRKDREDADNELEEQFDYAEQDDLRKEFAEKIQMGMPVQKALAEVTDAKLKRDFYEEYYKHQMADAQMQDPITGKRIEIPESGLKTSVDLKSKDNLLPEQTRGAEKGTGQLLLTSIMDEAASPKDYINRLRRYIEAREANGENKKVLEYLYDHLAKVKKASEALDRNRQQAFYAMRNLILSELTSSGKTLTDAEFNQALDDLGLYVPVSDTLASITADASFGSDFVKQEALQTPGLKVPPRKSYDFRKPFTSVADKIPAKNGHGEFTAAQIYKTFDILKNYSLKQIKLSKNPPPVFKDYKKERTTLGETEKLRDYPTGMDKAQYDELSSTDINPAELANYYLKGKSPAEQMKKLAAVPSSKYGSETIKQDFGGLGEGFAPLVFVDMIRTFYEDLKIDTGTNKELLDALEKNILKIAAQTKAKPAYLIKTSALNAFKTQMAEVAKPIVQAVIDARGVDVYGTYNPNKDNVLQYDPLEKPTQFDEEGNEVETTSKESGDIIDPSFEGSIPPRKNMKKIAEDLNRAVKQGKISKEAALKKMRAYYRDAKELPNRGPNRKERPTTLDSIVKDKLKGKSPEEIQKIQKEMESGMTDEFKKVQLAQNVKGILGSDILTSDVDSNLGKATLLSRLGSSDRLEEARKWFKEKKSSFKDGSFKMNYVDRADPLKKYHSAISEQLEKIGFDQKSELYSFLNLHGRYHQYFGKGYNTIEQAEIRYIEPIKDLMREYGVSQEMFGNYLLARSAPTRNLQFEVVANERLDAYREEFGEDSKEYKEEFRKYYDEKGVFKLTSGIDTDVAVEVVRDMEAGILEKDDKPDEARGRRFVEFAEKALPLYYKMNKQALQQLVDYGLIQQLADGSGFQEQTRMIEAASRFNWKANEKGYSSKVNLPIEIGTYSYSPMQGFRGETEAYFNNEKAWEDFGMSGTASGKGLDQPKSNSLVKGAFGRHQGQVGPDPNTVLATAVNQFFDSSIRGHKNEVAREFGQMYEFFQRLFYPEVAERLEGKDNPAENPNDPFHDLYKKLEAMGKEEREAFLEPMKKEFDSIFVKEFKQEETKKIYEYDEKADENGDIRMVTRVFNRNFQNKQELFTYRKDGEPKTIEFKQTPKGLAMADTMKNLRYESLPEALQFFNRGTRGMAQMFTSMNPAFLIPNFFRDLATAAIHLTEDEKKVMLKDTITGVKKGFSGVLKAERMIAKKMNPSDIKEVQELMKLPLKELAVSTHKLAPVARYQKAKQYGSKIGYFRHESIPERILSINKGLKKGSKSIEAAKKMGKSLFKFVDTANTAIENSIRISAFWAAVKNDFPVNEAAVIARNVTVDFNQKGNLTQAFGSLYVFFGASMNSAHRFVTSWQRRSPEERAKMFGGIIAASMVLALFNRLLDDDEEEEIPDYDTISSYKRDTHAIIPIPAGMPEFFNDEKDTGYFSMPLPLGYNVFWTAGQVAADWIASSVFDRGGAGPIEGTARIISAAQNAFNPIGGSTIATMLTPTTISPFVELYANKNFMGNAIRYPDRPFEVPKPAFKQDPKSTPEHWTDLSKNINEFMGGSDSVKGSAKGMLGGNPLLTYEDDIKFDMSGNQLKHLFYGYLGGPGQILDFAIGSLYSGRDGSSIKTVGDVPVFNRFLRATTYGVATRDAFYGLRETVKNAETALKGAKNIGPQAYNAVRKDNLQLLRLSSEISAFDKKKNGLSRLKKEIESSKRLTDEQKTQRVDEIQKQELDLMRKIIKRAQGLGI